MSGQSEDASLVRAVTELTTVVRGLDKLLRDEYPRRSEVERRFVTKLQSQKNVTKMVILAVVTIASCYVINVGAYSVCFVGDLDNPVFCKILPGYNERVGRTDQVNKIHLQTDLRLRRLEEKAGIKSPPSLVENKKDG